MAGIVDPDVDATEALRGESDHIVNLSTLANIAGESQGIFRMADTGASSFGAGEIPGEQDDAGAVGDEELGDGFSDAHGGAGDNDNISG